MKNLEYNLPKSARHPKGMVIYSELVMNKTCTKCLNKKPMERFSKHSKNIGHFQSWCKDCVAVNRLNWKAQNPTKVKVYDAKYRLTKQRKEYVARYKKTKEYRLQQAEYRKLNRSAIARYVRERAKTDLDFKLKRALRSRVYMALKERRFRKGSNTEMLIGCSFEQLKSHIEAKFKPAMSWKNYGPKWHIDHIKPLCLFDLSSLNGQKMAFHYSNLQPLFAKENLSKSGKYQKSG